jgi:hypothetical protein
MSLRIDKVVIGLLIAGLAATTASADEVFLRGGGRITGIVVESTKDSVAIETGPGRVTLPMSRVLRIVDGRSTLEVYRERADALEPGNVAGWADLARWAAERDLVTQSREAWRRVLASDPSHREANAALGRVEVDGVWLGQEDAYRARGFVSFEGSWVTPAEHEALARQRVIEEMSERDRRESEIRLREAEARAREAESRALEVERAAQAPDGGVPWWGGSGGWSGGWSDGWYGGAVIRTRGSHAGRPHTPVVRPTPAPNPRPTTPPATRPPRPPKKPSRIDPPPPKPGRD